MFTGKLTISTSGTYTFQSTTDDIGALYINGALITSSTFNTVGTSAGIPLTAGTSYDVAYYHNQGTGPWSYDLQYSGPDTGNSFEDITAFTQASDAPHPVAGFAAVSPDAGHVNLSWTANLDATLDYVIQRSTDATFATGVTTLTSGITSNSLVDTSIAPGTHYFYRIQGANFDSASAFSAAVSVTTSSTLAVPTGVTTQQGGTDNIVKFNYNLAATGLASFTILRSTNGGGFTPLSPVAPATSTTYIDSAVPITTPGTTYAYEVQANATTPEVNSAASTPSATETFLVVTGTTATPLTSAPTAPIDLEWRRDLGQHRNSPDR